MRRAARTDGNQTAIVKALRDAGASVHSGAAIGKGFPDIVVGYAGRTLLFEIKDPTKPKADRQLTPDQVDWHKLWRGHVAVVESVNEALDELHRQM